MMKRKVVVSITTLAAAVAAALQPAIAADDNGLEEIVVTARKRSEDILKTPIAVSAITGEDIAAKGIVSLTDLANYTPGFSITSVNSGRNDRSFQQITLRGFTPSTTTFTLTATFIDGVPVASATGLNAVTNPERVEVLKGPQSAYFGRNTFAGAVNVVNRMPSDTFQGEASAMAGTRDNKEVSASIEGPIAGDKLSFRLSGRTFAKSGSYKNQANMSQTLGDQSSDTATLMLVSKPTEKLTLKVFGMMNKDEDGPSAQGQLSAWEVRSNNGAVNFPRNSGNSNGALLLPSLANCTYNGYTSGVNPATEARVVRPFICGAAPSLPSGFSPAQNTTEDALLRYILANPTLRTISPSRGVQGYGLKGEFRHFHGTADWEIGDTGLTLSWLGGKNWDYISELADLDNYDNSLFLNTAQNPTNNQGVRTTWDFPFLVERKNMDWSQELRLSYDKQGAFNGVIGASYLKTESEGDLVNVSQELLSAANLDPATGKPRRALSTLNAPARAETTGVFFGATYKFGDAFSLSAEGRFQRDKINGYAGGLGATVAGVRYNAMDLFVTKTFDNFLPRVIAQWNVTPDVMAYASYSKGVNVGLSSFNTQFLNGTPKAVQAGIDLGLKVVVNPEYLKNYEVGLKGKFLDGKLRTQLAVYDAKWTDQVNRRSTFVVDDNNVIQIVSGSVNSGDVDARGVELDLAYRPIEAFEVSLGLAMNDTSINKFSDPNVTLLTGVFGDGFKGKQLPLSSKYSGTLGLQYGGDLSFEGGGSWFVRSDTFYKSKQFVDSANLTWIKARTQTNLRAGITKGPLTFEAFVTNAFNDKNYVSIAENTLLAAPFGAGPTNSFAYLNVALPELRVFGGRIRYKF